MRSVKHSKQQRPLYLMLIPAVAAVFIFNYIPMFGMIMSFQKYVPSKGILGSQWVGLKNYAYLLNMPGIYQVLYNTLFIAILKIIGLLIIPVVFSLLLNEVSKSWVKRTFQTVIYLPHFLSWVILSGILIDILSPSQGIINQMIKALGFQPIYFLGSKSWFPFVIVVSDIWKEFGFSTIVYMAALTGIDPTQYEAAIIDGANRWKQTIHITLPGILPIVALMTTLSLGNIMNAGFEQVFNMYNPAVYQTGDIIDTLIYRIGFVNAQYSLSTAVGLFKSIVSFVLVYTSYRLADRYAGYRVF